MRGVKILPAVLEEVDEASFWYDEHGYEGLGEQFGEAFYGCLPQIQCSGEIHRVIYRGFRKMLIRPFSYSLFYRLHKTLGLSPSSFIRLGGQA